MSDACSFFWETAHTLSMPHFLLTMGHDRRRTLDLAAMSEYSTTCPADDLRAVDVNTIASGLSTVKATRCLSMQRARVTRITYRWVESSRVCARVRLSENRPWLDQIKFEQAICSPPMSHCIRLTMMRKLLRPPTTRFFSRSSFPFIRWIHAFEYS